MREQCAVAATDIKHACARLDHFRDQPEIAAKPSCGRRTSRCCGVRLGAAKEQRGSSIGLSHRHQRGSPRCSAHPVRKPRSVSKSSGSCSRKASCPLSVSISTKLTLAVTAFNACTSSRLSEVGNSQSLVKEMMQNRERVPLKAFGSDPPCSAARSK